MDRIRLLLAGIAVAVLIVIGAANNGTEPAQAAPPPHSASGFDYAKYVTGPAVCDGLSLRFATYWLKGAECGHVDFQVSNADDQDTIVVRFIGSNNKVLASALATPSTDSISGATSWSAPVKPASTWPSGAVKVDVTVFGDTAPAGSGVFYVNHLAATPVVAPSPDGTYMPGDPLLVTGAISEVNTIAAGTQNLKAVPAKYYLRVVGPGGVVRGPYGPYTAGNNGTFSQGLPRSATSGFAGTIDTDYKSLISIEVLNATYTDVLTGAWAGASAGSTSVTLVSPPDRLTLDNDFTSDTGWVKPGDTYPFRVFVRNYMETAVAGGSVTIPAVDGTTFTQAAPAPGAGSAAINPNGSITWTLPSVPAAVDGNPAVLTLVAEATSDSLTADPQIVWKDLSSTATLTYPGAPAAITSKSLGPKVIPPDESFETARYGNRPFPVVPVDYFDRKHEPQNTAERLSDMINSEQIAGSTVNLYREMSFGQLVPNGDVPSAGITEAGWNVDWNSPRYQESGFTFSTPQPQGACTGASFSPAADTPLYPTRIENGWYQLPGDTNYYGADKFTGAGSQAGAQAAVGLIFQIDDACGPTGKAVYDAAHIADPDIDYSDFDTDKDGVVDFFMMVFAGLGGNGDSLVNGPGYDNIWPHSSSLEFNYTDPVTHQPGYVSDDQLKDLEGRPLYFTTVHRFVMTTDVTEWPVYVRVGPYNVNPESAIEHASVISHEYGHSLGLPDFYSHGTRATYGDWTLMANDKSQHIDVFGKQELGWLIPRVLPLGETTVSNWRDSKYNTHRIDWVQPDGTPYTLTGPSVNNGEAYVAKLPGRDAIDPAKVIEGASPSHVWWSGAGNGYGCTPLQGHNLDIILPQLENVVPGTPITLTFKSYWDIEWDYDYAFVMSSVDNGSNYVSHPSANGYTTPSALNPQANACQQKYGNGLTGSSASYAAGTYVVDRANSDYPDGGFIDDEYDLSALAGQASVLRFSYATDPGLARAGWFIDDLKITAGDQVIYQSDFEDTTNPAIYNGGCRDGLRSGAICTGKWRYIDTSTENPADHAYFLEMRDRSGFDMDSHGQNDREALAFEPGLLLVYTDENHGYGNFGTDDPPAQSPLDSTPEPGAEAPNLNDATFRPGARGHFSDSGPIGHRDNYDTNPTGAAPGYWDFLWNCLTFDVLSMSGDGIGPVSAPGDLVGTVKFTLNAGCGQYNYGYEGVAP